MCSCEPFEVELSSVDGSNDSYEQAMVDIAKKAESLIDDPYWEEIWLLWVSARLKSVGHFPVPDANQWSVHPQGVGVKVFRRPMGRVIFCDLLIEPNGVIPMHSHHRCNGVMRVVEGEVSSQNYEIISDEPSRLVLQPTMEAWMTAGRTMTLSSRRDNVHKVVAGAQGARVVDVFVAMADNFECRYIKCPQEYQSHSMQLSHNSCVDAQWL